MVSVADYGPKGRDLAGSPLVAALSNSHLPPALYCLIPGSSRGGTWTDCEEAGDYVVPNVLSPRDLICRPGNMDETVLNTNKQMTKYDFSTKR